MTPQITIYRVTRFIQHLARHRYGAWLLKLNLLYFSYYWWSSIIVFCMKSSSSIMYDNVTFISLPFRCRADLCRRFWRVVVTGRWRFRHFRARFLFHEACESPVCNRRYKNMSRICDVRCETNRWTVLAEGGVVESLTRQESGMRGVRNSLVIAQLHVLRASLVLVLVAAWSSLVLNCCKKKSSTMYFPPFQGLSFVSPCCHQLLLFNTWWCTCDCSLTLPVLAYSI